MPRGVGLRTDELAEDICDMYRDGASQEQIAKVLRVGGDTIRYALREAGIETRFQGHGGATHQEIADAIFEEEGVRISRQRVLQIEAEALHKLKRNGLLRQLWEENDYV